jgi:hypothetical protein
MQLICRATKAAQYCQLMTKQKPFNNTGAEYFAGSMHPSASGEANLLKYAAIYPLNPLK